MIKIKLRFLFVQFPRDQHKTLGGVTDKRYVLSEAAELRTKQHEPLKAKYHVLLFFEKAGNKNDHYGNFFYII